MWTVHPSFLASKCGNYALVIFGRKGKLYTLFLAGFKDNCQPSIFDRLQAITVNFPLLPLVFGSKCPQFVPAIHQISSGTSSQHPAFCHTVFFGRFLETTVNNCLHRRVCELERSHCDFGRFHKITVDHELRRLISAVHACLPLSCVSAL